MTRAAELVKRHGIEPIDQDAVQQAIDGFNLRITPERLQLIRKPGNPIRRRDVHAVGVPVRVASARRKVRQAR